MGTGIEHFDCILWVGILVCVLTEKRHPVLCAAWHILSLVTLCGFNIWCCVTVCGEHPSTLTGETVCVLCSQSFNLLMSVFIWIYTCSKLECCPPLAPSPTAWQIQHNETWGGMCLGGGERWRWLWITNISPFSSQINTDLPAHQKRWVKYTVFLSTEDSPPVWLITF